jgi:hypothetical protein
MVPADVRDDAYQWRHYVRAVQPAAEPGLDHGDIRFFLAEPMQRQGHAPFKKRSGNWLKSSTVLFHELRHGFLGHHFAVDAEALAEVLQMRRSVQAGAVAGFLQHARQHVRGAAFAVGAS